MKMVWKREKLGGLMLEDSYRPPFQKKYDRLFQDNCFSIK